jgi:hypothetical protein
VLRLELEHTANGVIGEGLDRSQIAGIRLELPSLAGDPGPVKIVDDPAIVCRRGS